MKFRLAVALVLVIGAIGAALYLRGADDGATRLSNAAARIAPGGDAGTLEVTMVIETVGRPDRLLGASSPEAESVTIVGGADAAGLPIPEGAAASLAADGAHLVATGLSGALEEGRLIPLTLQFEAAGEASVKARLGAGGGMDHAMMGHAMGEDLNATLSLIVTPEGAGWRISAAAPGFSFAPEAMDGPHVAGEGHAHLYIGGLKIMRMTAPEVLIGALPPGAHEVLLALNTNDHRPYLKDGAPITAHARIDAE